jgi:hypothetical protein
MQIKIVDKARSTTSSVDMAFRIAAKDVPYYIEIKDKDANREEIKYIYNISDKIHKRELKDSFSQIVLDSNPDKILSIVIDKNQNNCNIINRIVKLLVTNNIKICNSINYDLKILKKLKEKKEACI